ncbi:ATP-binding protein [Glycocaulis alkaliphilus]|uniref:ATP-binding protein n=1 Tax=Glycocaulis alkaliphilus TaxID=1434191 RepID=UPI001662AEBA|nr:ATP-binding protein [Glycocaulis alkaliphilus]GGB87197.1 hypothetical protein GCM10007417_29020 [Glycocaulis alkaliphilus]
MERNFLYQNFTVPNILDLALQRMRGKDVDVFTPSGLCCFCGVQGSGKTLSAVLYLKRLMTLYPKAICVSNIQLNFFNDRIQPYTGVEQLNAIENGKFGVIFMLDEIQIEFNSLESKMMNTPIFELVCQQRKQRKHIIGTTQTFGRLAKPFREQFKNVVLCNNFLRTFFIQKIFSAENVATEDDIKVELKPMYTKMYIPSPVDFSLYDTYQQVKRIRKGF